MRRIGATDAFKIGATDGVRPTIGELIVRLDGKTVTTAAGEVKLSTATVVGTGRDRRRQPNQEVRFRRLGLDGQVLHRLISPSIAYFLLVAGLALLVFEFYTAGVGLAGLVGALCVVGAFVGFSHLPVHWWAFALLLFATFGFSVDVQVGIGRRVDGHRRRSRSARGRCSCTAAPRSSDRRGGCCWWCSSG